ncbi:hypothetical protein BCR42DRAFT_487994 [Absidia repens]|uniref:Uncharacterized protein n=1 Tax=Absidia repens TaxID=90262 RepID=A0A1X2IUH2_9FUNG|nr:hypothetical protein BCR42DRAFT_487994 [Absidia repens]
MFDDFIYWSKWKADWDHELTRCENEFHGVWISFFSRSGRTVAFRWHVYEAFLRGADQIARHAATPRDRLLRTALTVGDIFLVWNGDIPLRSSGHSEILEWIGGVLVESTLLGKATMVFEWDACFLLSATLSIYALNNCWFGSIWIIWHPIEIIYTGRLNIVVIVFISIQTEWIGNVVKVLIFIPKKRAAAMNGWTERVFYLNLSSKMLAIVVAEAIAMMDAERFFMFFRVE